jgi:hypothetical protein
VDVALRPACGSPAPRAHDRAAVHADELEPAHVRAAIEPEAARRGAARAARAPTRITTRRGGKGTAVTDVAFLELLASYEQALKAADRSLTIARAFAESHVAGTRLPDAVVHARICTASITTQCSCSSCATRC